MTKRKEEATQNVQAHVRQTLEAATKGFNKLASDQAKLNDKRTGNYTSCMDAAREAVTAAVFREVWDGLKADIQTNAGGIGRSLGCKLGKPDKEGNSAYTVPAGMQVAVSVILGAMEYGISLYDKDGAPRSFGEVRKLKGEADQKKREAEAAAKMTPTEKAQAEVLRLLEAVRQNVQAYTEKEATETAAILASLLKKADGSEAHGKKAA